jgi:hypothetical protein
MDHKICVSSKDMFLVKLSVFLLNLPPVSVDLINVQYLYKKAKKGCLQALTFV